jgi:predicted nucleic acid-binding protein
VVVYYTDTSALLKQYVDEMGSDWLRATIAPTDETIVVFSQLLIIEVTSALNRRVREGAITLEEYPRVLAIFHDDCRDEYHFFGLNDDIVDLACMLLERYPLRAYDATHLATALTVHRLLARAEDVDFVFLCADDRMNNAASAEGLAVDNPNHHP